MTEISDALFAAHDAKIEKTKIHVGLAGLSDDSCSGDGMCSDVTSM